MSSTSPIGTLVFWNSKLSEAPALIEQYECYELDCEVDQTAEPEQSVKPETMTDPHDENMTVNSPEVSTIDFPKRELYTILEEPEEEERAMAFEARELQAASAAEEIELLQPVKPGLTASESQLQSRNLAASYLELDESEYPQLQREMPKKVPMKKTILDLPPVKKPQKTGALAAKEEQGPVATSERQVDAAVKQPRVSAESGSKKGRNKLRDVIQIGSCWQTRGTARYDNTQSATDWKMVQTDKLVNAVKQDVTNSTSKKAQEDLRPEVQQVTLTPEEPKVAVKSVQALTDVSPEEPQVDATQEETLVAVAQPIVASVPKELQEAAAPEEPESAKPLAEEIKPLQRVNPWLKATGTNIQNKNKELDESEYPQLQRELPKTSHGNSLIQARGPASQQPKTLSPEVPQVTVVPEQPQVAGKKIQRKPKHPITLIGIPPKKPITHVSEQVQLPALLSDPTTRQEAPKTKAMNAADTFFQQKGVKMVEVIEQDFLSGKGESTIKLEKENAALIAETINLKQRLRAQTDEVAEARLKDEHRISLLKLELLHSEATENSALLKARKLQEAIEKEKGLNKDLETSLAQQKEEISRLVAAQAQAKEDRKRQELQMHEERNSILLKLKDQQQALKHETSLDKVEARIDDLTKKMRELQEKPKKPSLWKRFLNFFK